MILALVLGIKYTVQRQRRAASQAPYRSPTICLIVQCVRYKSHTTQIPSPKPYVYLTLHIKKYWTHPCHSTPLGPRRNCPCTYTSTRTLSLTPSTPTPRRHQVRPRRFSRLCALGMCMSCNSPIQLKSTLLPDQEQGLDIAFNVFKEKPREEGRRNSDVEALVARCGDVDGNRLLGWTRGDVRAKGVRGSEAGAESLLFCFRLLIFCSSGTSVLVGMHQFTQDGG